MPFVFPQGLGSGFASQKQNRVEMTPTQRWMPFLSAIRVTSACPFVCLHNNKKGLGSGFAKIDASTTNIPHWLLLHALFVFPQKGLGSGFANEKHP